MKRQLASCRQFSSFDSDFDPRDRELKRSREDRDYDRYDDRDRSHRYDRYDDRGRDYDRRDHDRRGGHRDRDFRDRDFRSSHDFRGGEKDFRSDRRQQSAGYNLQPIKWENEAELEVQKDLYVESETARDRPVDDVKKFMDENRMTIYGAPPIPKPIEKFSDINNSLECTNHNLDEMFQKPSAIQSAGWPIAMSGRDLVGIAQTGSGKTLAYLLPAMLHVEKNSVDGTRALILAPTRELIQQIQLEFQKFSKFLIKHPITSAAVFGGVPRGRQISELRRGADIIFACPGRLLDFLESGVVDLRKTSYLVLDEADRMLDMGFEPQIRKIVSQLRPNRQTLMFSATWPKDIQSLARDFCREDPVRITIGSADLQANRDIKQEVIVCTEVEKREKFMTWLQEHVQGKCRVLIFCETKRACDALTRDLRYRNFEASAIHGDKEQTERDRVLHQFRESDGISILVATDVAQRGLDIKDVEYVVNFDIPKTIHDYIHRIGRTARAGQKGTAVTFFSADYYSNDKTRMAREICKVVEDVGQQPPEELMKIGKSY